MISVIVPIYNMEKYLVRCLESIIEQTVEDIEILLIDDGSTDSSAKICREYEKKDTRIKYIYKINGGLSDARNIGTVLAKGEYITYIDSDDYVHPTYLEYLLSLIKEYDADIAGCGHIETSSDNVKFGVSESRVECMSGYEACERAMTDLAPVLTSAWGNLYKRDKIKDYRFPYGRLHEDISTTFKYYLNSNKVVYSNKQLYAYYQRPDSIMHVISDKKAEDELWTISERAMYLQEMGESKLAAIGWSFLRIYLKRNALNQIGTEKLLKKYGDLYVKNCPNLISKLKVYLMTSHPELGRTYIKFRRKIRWASKRKELT